MAYCRKNAHSDVYLIRSGAAWYCIDCQLDMSASVILHHLHEVLDHLLRHRRAGEKVEQSAIDRVRCELEA